MNPLHRLAETLTEEHLTLSTAESCTGGGLAARITSIPGASNFYFGSVVAYANDLKIGLLGVSQEIVERHGAVSQQSCRAMAVGGRLRLGTDLCVSITGIAGPSGGTAEKPVGLVFIGVAGPKRSDAREFRFEGDRAAIQHQAEDAAIDMLLGFLSSEAQ